MVANANGSYCVSGTWGHQECDQGSQQRLATFPSVLNELEETQKPQVNKPEEKTSNAMNATLNLGHLGVLSDPEAKDPSEIVGIIHGQTARILLDSGCSTYVLDSNFAKRARILPISTKPVPIQLAV